MERVRVLIVEDDMDILDLLDYNFTRKGFLTEGAIDGEEAAGKALSFRPDVVILDLMLPKADGWEVCRRLKGEGRRAPVIMLTAKCMPEDRARGLEAGADDYVTKPFDVKDLIERARGLVEKNGAGKDVTSV